MRVDLEERIEGACRWLACEHVAGQLVDAAIDEIAAPAQLGPELLDAVLWTFERADAAELNDRRDVACRVEQDFLRSIADRRVLDRDVSQTQTGHRVRLAERVGRYRPLVHAGQRRDTDVL